MLIHLPKCASW